MTYPRDPVGLDWREHYTMANQVYYAYTNNNAPSSRVQPEEPVTGGVRRPKRGYASRYVGVIKMKNKFYAVWGKGKDGQKGGFPLTEEGAEAAAWVRARALGRDWLEDREIRQAPPPSPVSASPVEPQGTARGVSRRKLGGKRVA